MLFILTYGHHGQTKPYSYQVTHSTSIHSQATPSTSSLPPILSLRPCPFPSSAPSTFAARPDTLPSVTSGHDHTWLAYMEAVVARVNWAARWGKFTLVRKWNLRDMVSTTREGGLLGGSVSFTANPLLLEKPSKFVNVLNYLVHLQSCWHYPE